MLTSCANKTVQKEDLKHLSGYWEINEVIFSDKTTKEYTTNTTIDYIKLDDSTGFRKKVQPKLDGTFTTSDNSEIFTIKENNDAFTLFYKTDFSTREEQLIKIDQQSFIVKTKDNVSYVYKRYEPINITE